MARPAHRRVSRIVLLDQDDKFLLFLTTSPNLKVPVTRWITPGGGLDDHENHHDAACRELYEETGLRVNNLGDPFWNITGESVFNDGHIQSTYSEFFVFRTSHFEISRDNWMPNEHVDIADIKWWTLSELADSKKNFSPAPLVEIVQTAQRIA